MTPRLLDELASRDPGPAASSAAAATVAMAAALVARAARSSPDWEGAPGIAAQALRLRERADELVAGAGRAYAAAAEALAGRPGDGTLMVLLERAATAPLEIARVAADVALLGALAAEAAEDRVRPDALAAAVLAAGAASAAAGIVAVNLGVTADDDRLARAQAHARAAEASAAHAREALAP
jgi:formiminotetrahydrofolate cyclodeaminase